HVFVHRGFRVPPYPQYKLAFFPIPTALKQARDAGIEVVHCHAVASMGVAAIAAAKMWNLPLVGTFHTMIPQAARYLTGNLTGQRFLTEAAWRAIGLFYSPFDAVIAPSHVIRQELVDHGVNKVDVVANGIDAKRFNPEVSGAAVRRKLHAEKKKIVLIAGRMGFEKNIDTIIKAAPFVLESDDALFVFTGKGPAKTRCQKLARELKLGGNAVFTGFVPDELLPQYYAAADLFVTASTFETQCLVLYEAMACGKPVVGADALAIPEAVRDGETGFLFKPLDERDCADKISHVLEAKPAEAAAWSKNCRKLAERKTAAASVDGLLSVYEREIRNKGK
ncbi:hypothetical protein COY71_02175, partial [Candidatus Micrarchaeota archaeon CG_4_10_14_0_8_um_filter_60_7]